jgi:hypothetical protein
MIKMLMTEVREFITRGVTLGNSTRTKSSKTMLEDEPTK